MIADIDMNTLCVHSYDISNLMDILYSQYDVKLVEMTKIKRDVFSIRFYALEQWHVLTYDLYDKLVVAKEA